LGKFGWIWKNLAKIETNLDKNDKIWANLIRLGQNHNLASSKTFDLLRICTKRYGC